MDWRNLSAADLVDRLAEHRTLGGAPREERAWLVAHGSVRQLNAGDILTPKGDPVAGMFIILEGRIAIFLDRGTGLHKVLEWRAGDVTGLLPYSRLTAPPADTIAQEPTVILDIDRKWLRDLILERDTDLVRLPWVGHRSRAWEPEPLRWLGVQAIYALFRTADRRENAQMTRTSAYARLAGLVSGR